MNGTQNQGVFIEEKTCIGCGACVNDCPNRVLALVDGVATVVPEEKDDCILCQHCMAICPVAAVSVNTHRPENSLPVENIVPDFANLEQLVRIRRSVRQFKADPVPQADLDAVMAAVAYAPVGANARNRRFTLVTDPSVMHGLRDRISHYLVENAGAFPESFNWLGHIGAAWLEKKRDVLFRNAPHLIIVTTGEEAMTGKPDSLIALSYFDLLAQAKGMGTVWFGFLEYIFSVAPQIKTWFGIGEDQNYGYAMLFGLPSVHYKRTVQYVPEEVRIVTDAGWGG